MASTSTAALTSILRASSRRWGFTSVITTWRAPEILKDNPRIASSIPNTPVTVVYRSGNSGTSNNTLQYLNAFAPSIWAKVQDDFSTAFPGGKPPANSVTGANSAGVIAQVNNIAGAITCHSTSVSLVWHSATGRLCCCRVVGVHMANPRLV